MPSPHLKCLDQFISERLKNSRRRISQKNKLIQTTEAIALRNNHNSGKNCKRTSNWKRHLRAWYHSSENTEEKQHYEYRLLITKEHEEKRLNFMKDWKAYTFEDVWITDECVFQLHRNKVQVWSSKKCPRSTEAVPKFNQKSWFGEHFPIVGFIWKS